ncbi:MAG: hypothetical protein ABR529_09115 [Actinomycetota bacterium]
MTSDEYGDRWKVLEDEVDRDYPPSVIPGEDNPVIRGTFETLRTGPTKYNPSTPIVELIDENGERKSLWLTSTVLRSQFARVRPKKGTDFVLKYRGTRQGAENEYTDYKLVIATNESTEIDWDSVENHDNVGEGGDF